MKKYVMFNFMATNALAKTDSADMYEVLQQSDAGFGEPYQQLEVEFDENHQIINVNIIKGVMDG